MTKTGKTTAQVTTKIRTTRKKKIIEHDVEQYFVDTAKINDILCYKFTSPQNSGVPDRILIGNGKTVFVELKAPGKKPRKLQEKVIATMKAHGAEVYVIDTIEQVDELFEKLSKKQKKKS